MAEEFDIDAYLRTGAKAPPRKPTPVEPPAEPPAAFDIDAYLSSAAPKVGAGETFINQAVNAVPLGRTLTNLLSAGVVQGAKALGAGRPGVRLTPEAALEAEAQGLPVNEASALPGVVDSFRQLRDMRDIRTDAGAAQNPWASRVGTGTGLLLSLGLPLPKTLGGAGFARQTGQALRTGPQGLKQLAAVGTKMGALQAAGDSRADLTSGEIGAQLADTVLGAGLGAAGAPLGFAAGKLAAPVVSGLGSLLRRGGINLGRKVLLPGGADSQSTRKALAPEAVEEALRSGAILPFGTTQGTLGRLNRLAEDVGAQYGDIVEGLAERGVRGPEVAPLEDALYWRALEDFVNSSENKAASDLLVREAQNARALAMGDDRLGLPQAKRITQSLQRQARYDRTVTNEVNEARKSAAAAYREATEKAVEDAAQQSVDPEIVERAESFVPVKRRLGRILEAEGAAERGAARAAQGSTFNLGDKILAAGAGDLSGGIATAVASKAARTRLPSAGATGLYFGGLGLQRLANQAGALPSATASGVSALERQQLADWLSSQDVTPDALAEALRRRRPR